ncbi:MAG: Fructan beta-fructosidase [Chitinophagaceae bacterium]|nr:Fructan beta-fructosidase [Chitinophagaceae bacterium]
MKGLLLFSLAVITLQSFGQNKTPDSLYHEKYRPQFHFSPAKNWTNDPNGLVYLDGEYHLFYQYNPFGNEWGHMSWGHAVSKDLVSWKQLPVAIAEEGNTMIFSGSCVIDKNNTAGFATKPGQVAMVAVYTAHITLNNLKQDSTLQNQHIAYSLDHGRTWTKYKGNPVLDLGRKDFRDPKVFWYEKGKKWIMTVVFPHEHIVQLYSSPDLKQWTYMSDFGPAGDINGIWECSDLLQVPVKGKTNQYKWVLLNSVSTTMQYFIGEFDGKVFHNEIPDGHIVRPDYGADFYAGITYNNLPAGSLPVLIGWANNWSYAGSIPTFPWKSIMSIPRTLQVTKINGEWALLEQPVAALKNYRLKPVQFENIKFNGSKLLPVQGQQMEMEITMDPGRDDSCGIKFAVGNSHYFTIGYAERSQELYIDRSNSGDTSFHPDFKNWLKTSTAIPENNNKIKLHIFFDKSIIEVFADDGQVVITEQIFPDEKNKAVVLTSTNGKTVFDHIKVWQLKSSWDLR